MTRKAQLVQDIINDIAIWDLDRLIEYAQESMQEDLSRLNLNMVKEYHRLLFGDKPDE